MSETPAPPDPEPQEAEPPPSEPGAPPLSWEETFTPPAPPAEDQPFELDLERAQEGSVAKWLGIAAFVAALALALLTRFYALDAKPLHHDEGVNAFFLTRLLEEGVYHYDPTNYHGPFLYYAGYLPLAASGSPGPYSLRVVPALVSALTLLLLLPLRSFLGWLGVAAAAWLLALSPTAAYVGRTAIHESYFVAAVLGAAMVLAAYAQRRRSWLPAALFVCLALAYANKETGVISYAALGVGLCTALLFSRVKRGEQPSRAGLLERGRAAWTWARETWSKPAAWHGEVSWAVPFTGFLLLVGLLFVFHSGLRVLIWREAAGNAWEVAQAFALHRLPWLALFVLWLAANAALVYLLWGMLPAARHWWRAQPATRRPWVAGGLAGAAVLALLFSSLFTSPRGLFGLTTSLVHWVARGVAAEKTGHEKALPYYLEILVRFELPLLLLVAGGFLAALVRRRPLGLFLAGWAASTAFVYSVLRYKTPWLIVNLSAPFALVAAYGVASLGQLLSIGAGASRRSAAPLLLLCLPCLVFFPVPAPELDLPLVKERGTHEFWGEPRDVTRWFGVPFSTWQKLSRDLNVEHPDDSRYHMVYGQTERDALRLYARLDTLLAEGRSLTVTAKEYWPLPAYIHPYTAGYLSEVPEALTSDLYVISDEQDWQVQHRTRDWTRERFQLRPGVPLILLIRPLPKE